MATATLRIDIPEDSWIGACSHQYLDATFEVLTTIPDEQSCVGLVEIRADSVDTIITSIHDHPAVEQIEVLSETNDTALVQFASSEPILLHAACAAGVPLPLPFTVEEGTATWELTTSKASLSQLAEELERTPASYELTSVRPTVEDDPSLLTDAQETVIRTALEAGYYETPREASLTNLADELDLAASTVSETLHRAEGKIVRHYVDLANIETTARSSST